MSNELCDDHAQVKPCKHCEVDNFPNNDCKQLAEKYAKVCISEYEQEIAYEAFIAGFDAGAESRYVDNDFKTRGLNTQVHISEQLNVKLQAAEAKSAKLIEVFDFDLDCGDNSCFYAKKKGGMRTNGGCRCVSNNQSHVNLVLRKIREAVAEAKIN